MRSLKNPMAFIDKTYPVGTEVRAVTVVEWTSIGGKPPSALMLDMIAEGSALPIVFPDGTCRYATPGELVDEELIDAGFEAFCQEESEL